MRRASGVLLVPRAALIGRRYPVRRRTTRRRAGLATTSAVLHLGRGQLVRVVSFDCYLRWVVPEHALYPSDKTVEGRHAWIMAMPVAD